MKSIAILLLSFIGGNCLAQSYLIKSTNKIYTETQWDSLWNASEPLRVKVLDNDFDKKLTTLEVQSINESVFLKDYQLRLHQKGKRKTVKGLSKAAFDSVASVQLVSFKTRLFDETLMRYRHMGDVWIPMINDKVDVSKMFEVKKLEPLLKNALIGILKEYHEWPKYGPICYHPRNAILFSSKYNFAMGYIEICFECLRHRGVPQRFHVSISGENFELLKELFIVAGIKYGTNPFSSEEGEPVMSEDDSDK